MTGDTLEQLLRGMASQIAEQEDATLCADIRNKLFGPLDFSRRDLAALNIMRGRDSGLPGTYHFIKIFSEYVQIFLNPFAFADYNTVRKYYSLPRVNNWSDINPSLYSRDRELFEKLEEVNISVLKIFS